MDDLKDVAVIGGGPAGLSGALMLARSRRSVVVVDAGEPRNRPATAMHGFLTRDGTPPGELLAAGRAEVERYGARLVDGSVVTVKAGDGRFDLTLADGAVVSARRLLVTTGLVDELPAVPGVRELWGDQVIHCPYCHGWEVRDQAIGVLGSGPLSTHQALLFRQLSADVVFFGHTHPPSDDQRADLAARRIPVVDGAVSSLEIVDGRLTGVRLADGRSIPRQVVVVAPRFVARSEVLESLGVEVVEQGPGIGWRVAADATGRTNVPGVWAAGNVTDLSAQVIVAAAAGATAATHINADLVTEDVRRAAAGGID
ncbi:MAG: NAD(P)/FAD-dependent oxidoreductase [Actinomycetota bacterium]|jgi:thioredoxin reductase